MDPRSSRSETEKIRSENEMERRGLLNARSTRGTGYSTRSLYALLHLPFYHINKSAFVKNLKTKGKSTNLRIAISDGELSSRVSLVRTLLVLNVAGSVEGSSEADERVGVGDVEASTSSGDGGSDESSESAGESLEISSGDESGDGSYGLRRY